MKKLALFSLLSLSFFCVTGAYGEQASGTSANVRTISVLGRKEAVVTAADMRLSDLADIHSKLSSDHDDEAIIALQKIVLGRSPAPGQIVQVAATDILAHLRTAGVNLDAIGYTFPKSIAVRRASRPITASEVTKAMQEAIQNTGRDIALKNIYYDSLVQVVPGALTLRATPYSLPTANKLGFSFRASVEGSEDVRFDLQATVDEWREIPVAKRSVPKGEVVEPDDVMMARLNIGAIPHDAAFEDKSVLGFAATEDIQYGEIFRKGKLNIPLAISAGSRVTMVYRSGVMEISATGTATENGILGQQIKIRNDASKRIVIGTVLDTGLVGVKP